MSQPYPVKRRASAASPHRAGFHAGLHPEDQPYSSTEFEADVDDSYYNTRLPTSARRYQTTEGTQVIRRGNKQLVIHEGPPPRRRSHWVSLFVSGMVVMLLLYFGLSALSAWWQEHQVDSQYGFPRTYQLEAGGRAGKPHQPKLCANSACPFH